MKKQHTIIHLLYTMVLPVQFLVCALQIFLQFLYTSNRTSQCYHCLQLVFSSLECGCTPGKSNFIFLNSESYGALTPMSNSSVGGAQFWTRTCLIRPLLMLSPSADGYWSLLCQGIYLKSCYYLDEVWLTTYFTSPG